MMLKIKDILAQVQLCAMSTVSLLGLFPSPELIAIIQNRGSECSEHSKNGTSETFSA
jgi:hypothetical protein